MSVSIPVTVLAGFLGAGKTTLLNSILRGDHGLRIAVVINDFGAIDIDRRLVTSVEGEITSLSNGCICCDSKANLRETLFRLLARDPVPEHIVIEASGIADPVAIVGTLRISELRDRLRLDGVITVVDAEHAQDPRLDAQLIRDQIQIADVILLNKVDLVSEELRAELATWLRSLTPRAQLVETVQCSVPLDLLLGTAGAPDAVSPGPHPDHHHGAEYDTWSYESEEPVQLHVVIEALKGLPHGVFRVKGILRLSEAPGLRVAVHVVGNRISSDVLGPWQDERPCTRLVFIGSLGALDINAFRAWLDAAAVQAAV